MSLQVPFHEYQAAVKAAEDALAEVERLTDCLSDSTLRWIPVSERLPKLREYVLVCWSGRYGICNVAWRASERQDIGWESCQDGMELRPPTHWMPLPEAPK